MFNHLKAFLLLTFVLSCATAQNLKIESTYKREMVFEIDGRDYKGTADINQRDRHEIEFDTSMRPNLFRISTCHRELTVKKPDSDLEYDFLPVEREKVPMCLMYAIALDQSGENAWAMINFIQHFERLEAHIGCNGLRYNSIGSALCQARQGLVQTISFESDVNGLAGEGCGKLREKDSNSFEFLVSEGVCHYLFDDGKEFFRLVTFGYNEVLIYD